MTIAGDSTASEVEFETPGPSHNAEAPRKGLRQKRNHQECEKNNATRNAAERSVGRKAKTENTARPEGELHTTNTWTTRMQERQLTKDMGYNSG
ncbi:hypothetical protein NDU88_004442 [Pleurodeles waltl]|uniref:Uncharacterized protein n=1 Tax=Pleurodeles waltl TaxID=8319 RepID=A0AAV7RG92_PLEWA|nr:hypothetical protein NDU88_004442 [Pleurodeles waltl]